MLLGRALRTGRHVDDTYKCPSLDDSDHEVAKQWVAGALAPEAVAEFEVHLRECARCQRATERAAEVTAALRAAAHNTPTSPMQRFANAVADQARALADNFRQGRPR